MRFRAPANVLLRRAQLVLMLATLVPTVLMTALGIVLLITGSRSVAVVAGVLVLAFCTSSVTGYILGSIFVSKGASLARVQHDYLSIVSHELNTPLTSILMFIDTLHDGRLSEEDKEKCLSLLHQETERMSALVARLQELARIETGQHAFEKEPVSVDEVVEESLRSFRAATLPDDIPVDTSISEGLVVRGDKHALVRAITNLLTNAWKYTDADNRKIELKVVPHGKKFVELSVIDNGAGIPRAEQRQIFQKFERGEHALQSGAPGTGLGLAIVSAIVRAHRGKVDIQSKPGRGSQFRILLRREGQATT